MTYPTVEYIREALELDPSTYSGLRWREDRPASHFTSRGRTSGWYSRFAGKPAGTMLGSGAWVVRLGGRNITAKQLVRALTDGTPVGPRLTAAEQEKTNQRRVKAPAYDWM